MEWSRSVTRIHPKCEAPGGREEGRQKHCTPAHFAWLLTSPVCLPYGDKLHLFHSFYSNCGIDRSSFLPSSLMSLINNNGRIYRNIQAQLSPAQTSSLQEERVGRVRGVVCQSVNVQHTTPGGQSDKYPTQPALLSITVQRSFVCFRYFLVFLQGEGPSGLVFTLAKCV